MLTLTGLVLHPAELDFAAGAESRVWLLLLGVGVVIGSMTYAVLYGLARVPANQAIVILPFKLVVAAIAAYLLSDKRMDVQGWIGTAMSITASLFFGHKEDA
ncbi:EamA family transporter [Thiobacillus denitrificans]|uniref:EamA family transporter n=1 Tax=Thiobacillus denitrificans TaxID=36861 RepID=UPI0003787BDF|nr:EamA family transporter [Thiobacillus denitrificans]